jgi:hypothetical protein
MAMMQTGAIAGRVLDEDGEPMGHMIVMALEEQYRDGERFLNMIQSVATDESGNYRLYWLGPGPYYVAAVYEEQQRRTINPDPIPPGRRGPSDRATSAVILRSYAGNGDVIEETYSVVYNGSVTDWEKTRPVDVRAGLTTAGIDIANGSGKGSRAASARCCGQWPNGPERCIQRCRGSEESDAERRRPYRQH